ncbi:MAG: hypothetical protein M1837_004813 [Sclerophora amabilis]|nr:MAG: hypothetical protein M1837_004813 [Sclerophora amabilis]
MSKIVHIGSPAQFSSLISSSTIVVTDFYADWCAPCKQIAPIYEQLSTKLTIPNKITFTKVDVDKQREIAQTYGISAMPTFMIFKNAKAVSTIRGADPRKLSEAVQKLATEAESNGSASSGGFGEATGSGGDTWMGATPPRGFKDVSDQVDIKNLDLLNADSDFGNVRTLFEKGKPTGGTKAAGAVKGKGKSTETAAAAAGGQGERKPDWVESDTDEQMMLFMPFQSTLKVHSLHITSLPPTRSASADGEDDDDDEIPMRPKTISVYSNRAHVLGFEEAEDIPATQTITLSPGDWDEKTGTAKVELRFVKFQNVTSLVVFIIDGDGESEKVRVDRLRIIGESGEKREMGKLEKIGDELGE